MSSSSKTWSLQQLFGFLDQNKDGIIDLHDIIAVCNSPMTHVDQEILMDLQTKLSNQLNEKQLSFSDFVTLLYNHSIVDQIQSEHLGKVMTIVVTHTTTPKEGLFSSDTLKHLMAGAVAGALSRTVVSPMERMKILFQIQGPQTASAYTGIWSTLNKIWKEEGFKGFMRGNGTNVIRMIPYSASQFAAYEQFKSMLIKNGKKDLDTPSRLLAGALAGTVSVACTYPLDLVRTRLSINSAIFKLENNKRLSGIWPTMSHIYRTEGGVRGLYRGLWPTTLGVAPYVALNFQCYEVLKGYLIPVEDASQGNIRKLFCGALAGSIAQTIIYPLDVLRRRFQVSGMNNMDYKYNGTWHALKTMTQKEGFKSLYRGLLPNYLKVAPAMGVTFYSYELCKEIMHAK